jgi:hypothetical protein
MEGSISPFKMGHNVPYFEWKKENKLKSKPMGIQNIV